MPHSSILFVDRAWHGIGGMQTFHKDLVRALKEQGVEVEVCVPSSSSPLSLFAFLFKAIRACRKTKHTRILFGDCSLVWLAQFSPRNARRTVLAHGLDVLYKAKWYQFLLRRYLQRMHRVLCISEYTAGQLRKRHVLHEKITILPCGIWPIQESPHTPEPGNILLVGRLVPRKGTVWFLEHVLPVILHEYSRIHVHILGTGPEEKRIRLIVHNTYSHCVTVHGCVSEKDKFDAYKNASMCVFPNISVPNDAEGFGMVCIEASSWGVSVVASHTDGIPSAIVPGKTGVLFEEHNSKACAEAIMQILRNPLKREDVRLATEERYSWHILGPQYAHVLTS